MDSVIEIIKALVGRSKPAWQENIIPDSTLYQVESASHIYCGRIQYQDDVFIKLVTEKPRVVKILKENIRRITIVKKSVMTEKIYA